MLILIQNNRGILSVFAVVFIWPVLTLTIISLVGYIWRSREVLREG